MVIVSRASRRSRVEPAHGIASIREVCLLGVPTPRENVGQGDAVSWAGRNYRIVATDQGDTLHVRPIESMNRHDP